MNLTYEIGFNNHIKNLNSLDLKAYENFMKQDSTKFCKPL